MSKGGLLKYFLIFFALFNLIIISFLLIWKEKIKAIDREMAAYLKITIFVLLIPVFVPALAYLDAKYVEPNWIKVEKLVIRNKRFSYAVTKLKIVQISDLHIEKIGIREKSLISKINGMKPDILFITGDFISTTDGVKPMVEVISSIHAAKGIYGIFGNIDFAAFSGKNIDELRKALETARVHILNNSNIMIPIDKNSGIRLIGLEGVNYNKENILKAYSGVNFTEPKILLAHSQAVMDLGLVNQENTDLVLTGDTHGGQLGLRFLYKFSSTLSKYKYMAGLFKINGVPLYVNRGIGTQISNLRFFCRPEITVIKLVN